MIDWPPVTKGIRYRARLRSPSRKEHSMSDKYKEFVRHENIKNFENKLETETDPARRDLLARLLAEEKVGKPLPIVTKP
jgi:hypothetical protein